MDSNIKRFNSTPLEYLSEEQMRDIHSAALEILQDCGAIIHHEKSIALLHQAGADVKDDRHVFIPGDLVASALGSAPSKVSIYNRNGRPAMILDGHNVYYGTGSDCPYLLDSLSGERRNPGRTRHSSVDQCRRALYLRGRHVAHGHAEHAAHLFSAGSHDDPGGAVPNRPLSVPSADLGVWRLQRLQAGRRAGRQ